MSQTNRGQTINIDDLNEADLRTLNRRVVERIRLFDSIETKMRMFKFHNGERVRFKPHGRDWIEGVVTRLNQKSISVFTDCGHHWKVHPSLLEKSDIIEGEVVEEPTGQFQLLQS